MSAAARRAAVGAWLAALALAATHALAQITVEEVPPQRQLDVPYVPTRQAVVEEMLKLAGVSANDVVYDLGCGDGRIVVTAARQHGARGVGIDIDPERISEAKYIANRVGVGDRVTFLVGDLFEADIREATVVTLYLLPEVNRRLKPKLLRELAPGTRVVSHDFAMGRDWPPERTVRLGRDTIYLWTIPPQRAARPSANHEVRTR
ncbi:MAG: class I SAM-dependent methyltransferase [Burkholderiales bacterium]|nr:class I SAM-dependent methyltransferase [Burkholderiales bacterium]